MARRNTYLDIPRAYIPVPSRPGAVLHVDFISFKPARFQGTTWKYALSIIDLYSSYCWVIPTRTMKSAVVIKALAQILPHTDSEFIFSDNASNLMRNKEVFDFCAEFGVTAFTTLPYSSRSMKAELLNKHVRFGLRVLTKLRRQNWPAALPHVVAYLNRLVHHDKKFSMSSFAMFYNREPGVYNLLGDLAEISPSERRRFKQLESYLINRFYRMKQQQQEAINKAKVERSALKVGSLVKLIRRDRDNDKQKPFYGPETYIVEQRVGLMLKIRRLDNPRITKRVHVRDVKRVMRASPSVWTDLDVQDKELWGALPPLKPGAVEGDDGKGTDVGSGDRVETSAKPPEPENQVPKQVIDAPEPPRSRSDDSNAGELSLAWDKFGILVQNVRGRMFSAQTMNR